MKYFLKSNSKHLKIFQCFLTIDFFLSFHKFAKKFKKKFLHSFQKKKMNGKSQKRFWNKKLNCYN